MAKSVLCGILFIAAFVHTYSINSCPAVCLCQNLIINCMNNELSKLPDDLNKNVLRLDVSFNNFIQVPTVELTNLRYLNMSHNRLTLLPTSSFNGMKNLENLDLSYNRFNSWTSINNRAFLKTKNLTELDFSYNSLGSFPLQFNILNIESLEILRMVNCSISSIDVSVLKMKNLKELYLSNNPISTINSNFTSSNLKLIDISDCNLKFICDNTFSQLESLESLHLKNNRKLKNIALYSESIKSIDLSHCSLDSVPKGNLRQLQNLNLRFNLIITIEDNSFKAFPNLQTINLSDNALTSIGENAFHGLDSLTKLDLSFNKLMSISENIFQSNIALKILNLSHNYFQNIKNVKSKSLQYLDMSSCEIYALQQDSLENMPNLEYLTISRNYHLSSLPDGLSSDTLRIFDISHCRIRNLNNYTFSNMGSLRYISLDGNLLTSVYPSYFVKTTFVNLDNNPWSCNCPKLKSMYEWLRRLDVTQLQNLICDTPAKYEGKTWRTACEAEWYPDLNKKDSLWVYSLCIVLTMVVILIAVVAFRKLQKLKELRIRQMEDARRAEERAALRRMQRLQFESQDETNRNAPDPRETQRPPSYHEAVLLPKLDASHPSLSGSLHSIASMQSIHGSASSLNKKTRTRRKRRRRKSDSSDGQRSSRVIIDSETSEPDSAQRREPLESDF